MDVSHTNTREYLRQAIDAEIKSLERSIRVLRLRRNALAPISSLPTEVMLTIFSLMHAPRTSSRFILGHGEKLDSLEWLHMAHVCHRWREIALNQPLFWSHFDFTTVSPAGAAEILARAKSVPLHLEANVSSRCWDNARVTAFQKNLRDHVSHIRQLDVIAETTHLIGTLTSLTSPAPALEYLSLTRPNGTTETRGFVPETLFDGSAPMLSCLELYNCAINWGSPLLRGLEHLDIQTSDQERPSLSNWLDVLDEMPQLKTLTLLEASPIAPNVPLPSNIKHTVTLPSLTLFDIFSSVRDCGLALAHLVLPALSSLRVRAQTCHQNGSDVLEILPYVTRHVHGLHHTQPIQTVIVKNYIQCVGILTIPFLDINFFAKLSESILKIEPPNKFTTPHTMHPVEVSITGDWTGFTYTRVFDAMMATLPLDGLATLDLGRSTRLNKQFWLRDAPQWHLVQCIRLRSRAASAFREMLLEDNERRESPLFPLLTKLVLSNFTLSARRTLQLCDALMNRVEQGVPLETLDLRTCFATRRAVEPLNEIVTEVLGPERFFKEAAQRRSKWDPTARGLFVANDSSEEDTDSGDEYYPNDWVGHFMWSSMDET